MAELKKCPFCGGEAEIISYYFKGTANRKHFFCQCKACGTRKQNWNGYRTNAKAIEAWNNRVTEAEIRANAIDEFAEKLSTDVESFVATVNGVEADLLTLDYFDEFIFDIAEQLKEE